MSKMRWELLIVVAVAGLGAALSSSPTPAAAKAPARPAYQGPLGNPRWGDNPCTVVLEKGQLNLVFTNTGSQDYHLYTGRGLKHFEVVLEKGKIVVEAMYHGCALQSVHDCYHHDVFNVPAGQTRTMHLGPAPASLKGFPVENPGVYHTYPPNPRGRLAPPRAPRRETTRSVPLS